MPQEENQVWANSNGVHSVHQIQDSVHFYSNLKEED